MTIIRLQDRPLVPWKNGMGSTREIAVYPPGAGIDDFIWRVSVAEVQTASPFSVFPGIDRHIALLDGAGFDMHMAGEPTHELRHRHVSFSFRGETAVTTTLVDGPTRDFNLMTRRGHACGRIDVLHGPLSMIISSDVALIYVGHGTINIGTDVGESGDAWMPSAASSSVLRIRQHGVALIVHMALHSSETGV